MGYLVAEGLRSQRRACVLVGISRSVITYPCRDPGDEVLRVRLEALASQYPRYGYLLLHGMLKREGLVINAKRTYRVYRQQRLQVRTKRRKRWPRQQRLKLVGAARPNQRWSMDFMTDQLAGGRRFRILNIVDDYSRQCWGQIVDFSISGLRLARYLDQVAQSHPLPQEIVVDNGPELTSRAMFQWAEKAQVRLCFIEPGKPMQNAFVESFNARFRDGCLNEHWFTSLEEARQLIEAWRQHYNCERPHSSLGYQTPEAFAATSDFSPPPERVAPEAASVKAPLRLAGSALTDATSGAEIASASAKNLDQMTSGPTSLSKWT